MTNYERIKAMSSEEMARESTIFFYHACEAENPKKCKRNQFVNGMSPCNQCVLKWLNSEVKDNG